MNINDKMIKIMILAAEHGYITSHESQYICGSRASGKRAIAGLRDLKFMNDLDTHLNPRVAYYLTGNGYKHLEALGKLRVISRFSKSDYTMTHFLHTTAGLQVRLLFEKHPLVVDYRPEKVIAFYESLQSGAVGKSKQCDAEVFIKIEKVEYKAGIEIELTSKSRETLVKNIKSIDVHREDLASVLWFASNEIIIRNIRDVINSQRTQLRFPDKHYFVLLKDLKLKGLDAPWYDSKGDVKHLFSSDIKHQPEQQGLI
ncbi:MAG: hypothetical protein QME68_00100 [Elusimicrobiota bacterium]|nr:hypothetical protein [Elusimicrobiota bacterium]